MHVKQLEKKCKKMRGTERVILIGHDQARPRAMDTGLPGWCQSFTIVPVKVEIIFSCFNFMVGFDYL